MFKIKFGNERRQSLHNRLLSLDTAIQELGKKADETPDSLAGDRSTHPSTLRELDMRLMKDLVVWDDDLEKEKLKFASFFCRKKIRDLDTERGILAAKVLGLYQKLAEGKKRFEESPKKPSNHQTVPRTICGPSTPDYGLNGSRG